MRFVLCLCLCLAPLATALGQGGDATVDPDATPFPPVTSVAPPVVAVLPGTAAAPAAAAITLTAATTPAQLAVLVGNASAAEIVRAVVMAATSDPAALANLLQRSTVETRAKIIEALSASGAEAALFVTKMASSGVLAASLKGVTPSALLDLLGTVASSQEAASVLLQTLANSEELAGVAVALQERLASRSEVSLTPVDLDVLLAISNFGAQDPRFQAISPYSYFGRKLKTIRVKIDKEGMTQANKAELVGVYRDATAALQKYIADEAAEAAR